MDARQEPGFASAVRELLHHCSPRRRWQLVGVLVLMLVSAAAELLAIGSILPFLSLLSAGEGVRVGWLFGLPASDEPVLTAALMFMGAVILAAALRLLLAWASQRFILAVGHDLSVDIQRRILLQPYSFHTQQNSSTVLASLEKVQIMISSVLLQLMHGATAVVIAAAIAILLVRVDPVATISAGIVLGTLYVAVSWTAFARLARNSATIGGSYDRRIKIMQESLGGIRDIIVDGSHDAFLDAFRSADRRFIDARASSAFIASAPRFLIEAAGMILIAALALVFAGRDGLAGALPVLGVIALGALRLMPLLQQLYRSWTSLAANRAVIGDVLGLLRLPVPGHRDDADEALQLRQSIRFENVSFAYPLRHKPALHDVSLTIAKGMRVAIIGRTGSGKSTMADLLMGLLEPDAGHVWIDDVALDAGTRPAWRRNVAHVPQSIFLADDSISANIAFGTPADRIDHDRVAYAARTAHLDEVIAGLPDGFATTIGERGVRLSGGQRQRLGLARAIYKQAEVLILDEATNALDHETELTVLGALDDLQKEGRTVILIAHRPSTVAGCDLVIRLEDGRIADGPADQAKTA